MGGQKVPANKQVRIKERVQDSESFHFVISCVPLLERKPREWFRTAKISSYLNLAFSLSQGRLTCFSRLIELFPSSPDLRWGIFCCLPKPSSHSPSGEVILFLSKMHMELACLLVHLWSAEVGIWG